MNRGPPLLKKSNSLFMLRFYLNLKRNIFICLPIIIEIEIYEWESTCLPGGLLSLRQKDKFFIYGAILQKFES